MVVECDRPAVEVRRRIGGRVVAQLHHGAAEIGARHPVHMHVAGGVERHPRGRGQYPVGVHHCIAVDPECDDVGDVATAARPNLAAVRALQAR